MKRFFFIFLSLSLSIQSSACVIQWIEGQLNYWPSKDIEVCFLPPDAGLGANDLEMFVRAKEIVSETYRKLNAEMPYRFWGFRDCKFNYVNKPKISIQLIASAGLGRAISIGPSSALTSPNLLLTTAAIEGGKNASFQPILERNLEILTLHETMHLLGFHHEDLRDDTKALNDPNRNIVVLSPPDDQSVMSLLEMRPFLDRNELVPRAFPFLSQEDRRCLDIMASQPTSFRFLAPPR